MTVPQPMNPAVSWVVESFDYEPLLQQAASQPVAAPAGAAAQQMQRLQARFW